MWDRQPHDFRTARPGERCDLVAYDCARQEFHRLPLEDATQIQQVDGDLLVAVRGTPGEIDYVGFDLATGKPTTQYAAPGRFLRVRDGLGYFLSVPRQHPPMPVVRGRGKFVVVDFLRQGSALVEHEFDLPGSEPFTQMTRQGFILQDTQTTLIPWAVRP